ncbi:hypothetical protein NCER_101895 [Vairimorpha ceranae BRL01]|uniref:Uncharacterized protein n=1 Tax=Vairimorpha ceranae (strain BRL01) TaxID=578460 RepID=C4VAY8_VAIC1|nr:hypothetical protein NCER_101895 [Vairimorpha ceranae BRL01]
MDNEFLNGLILSYNKILREIKIFKDELNFIKLEVQNKFDCCKNLCTKNQQPRINKTRLRRNRTLSKNMNNKQTTDYLSKEINNTNTSCKSPALLECQNFKDKKICKPKSKSTNSINKLLYLKKRTRRASKTKDLDSASLEDKSKIDFFLNLGNELLN